MGGLYTWVYDRHFRQIAVTLPGSLWARRDGDLWNMAFASSQRSPYCHYCFGSTHSLELCSGAPDTPLRERTFTPQTRKPRICREWNYSQCSYPGCQFIHACLTCFSDPLAGDSNHKVIHCPENAKLQQGPVVRPLMGTPYQYLH